MPGFLPGRKPGEFGKSPFYPGCYRVEYPVEYPVELALLSFLCPLGPQIYENHCSARGAGPSSRLKGGAHFPYPAQKVPFS